MRIAILDADLIARKRHRFPNLVCMKLSGYHKNREDVVELRTDYEHLDTFDKVYIAKVFTNTKVPSEVLHRENVLYGGTGFFYDKAMPLPYEIEHHIPDYHLYDEWISSQTSLGKTREFRYYTDYAIGYLTRGCYRRCSFCVNRNARSSRVHSPIMEFLSPEKKKICLLDDNFFACPHWKQLLSELQQTGLAFQFKQGLDERLLTDEICEMLTASKYDGEYIFAFDDYRDAPIIVKKLRLLRKYTNAVCKFYCFTGFDRHGKWDSAFWKRDLLELLCRIEILMQYRCLPYVMRYERYEESPYRGMYITISRWCNQPSFFKKKSLHEFVQANGAGSAAERYFHDFVKEIPEAVYFSELKYGDEGISGTNTKKRDGFNQMIEDALAGKIDLIITKSVSRFARNTVDSLQNVRKLKENGVEIYFEKENIWTFDSRGELLITIMSSLAQEESRSISENTTWGKRKQFAEGKTSVGYSAFLGYDQDFKINEEQAKVVKLIYKLFLGGRSFYAITKELEKRGIKSPSGKDKWYISTVRSILTNEKYRGDALIQKEYTADFLDKTRRKNTGEIPQYYVEEHHEAIIPPDLFDFVQSEIKRREQNGKHSSVSIFANKIKCGCCGAWYGAKVWHSTDKYRRVIYRCNKKYAHKGKPCSTRHLTEEEIKWIFVKALNSLMEVKENVIAELRSLIDGVCRMEELIEERNSTEQELGVLAERIETLIREHARVAQDQTAYLKQENEIRGLYVEKQGNLEKLDDQIAERDSKRKTLEGMIHTLCGMDGEQVEFDEVLWGGLLDYIVVKEDGKIVVIFKGGIEIAMEG